MHADDIIRWLALKPHPEGGYYRESFRDGNPSSGRSASTAIYYLLRRGDISRWHRVDATEIWHWYAGAPLVLYMSDDGKTMRESILGIEFERGQNPQIVIPKHVWQSGKSLGGYTLIGCTVAPGFEFSGFELAPDAFSPLPKAD